MTVPPRHAHPDPSGLSRRDLLRLGASGAAAVALAAAPLPALARPLRGGAQPGATASRRSRLGRSTVLAHGDLHNHTQLSDAIGDPTLAHTAMRDAGLDIAALTDHTVSAVALPEVDVCSFVPSPPFGTENPCTSVFGMNADGFAATGRYADAVDDPGSFTALRGFEWSSPYLGHMNVWFSEQVTDPLATGGLTGEGLAGVGFTEEALRALLAPLAGIPGVEETIEAIFAGEDEGMTPFYDWLSRSPQALLGGGADAIASFNHPNREPEAFDAFAFDVRVRERVVAMEIFNRREDYLFKNVAFGLPSPLVACLDAGWRVGLSGVTDEHGDDWGEPEGKGRAGLYVDGLDRAAVFSAMRDRRFFATREAGLRLDAAANGATRMGQLVPGRSPRLQVELDLAWDAERTGMPLEVQVLTSGEQVPTVTQVEEIRLPAPTERRPLRLTVPVDRRATSWAVLRIADPSQRNDDPGPDGHPCNNRALAYTSPFYLADARPARSAGPRHPRTLPSMDLEELLLGRHG